MMPVEPRVAIFSHSQPISLSFNTSDLYPWLAKGFETHFFNHDVSANLLVNNRFNLLVFVGNTKRFLNAQLNKIPKVFVDRNDQLTGDLFYNAYIEQSLNDYNPAISMFTPTYNSFERFDRLYRSIKEQSFTDWEWVILDDSPDNRNYEYMKKAVGDDHRIKLYKSNRRDALVGSTKRQAASLCNGDYLMEVDHDDELHHMALELCVSAFKAFPDAGFCYSNAAETFETGGNVNYGNGFAMGEGLHFTRRYKGRTLVGSDTPINASTIRHIVGVPNHFRCWKRDVYFQINRHNNKLSVVDDYEILIRTFLCTKMVHVPEILYIQYMNSGGNNTQEPRRKEIQRLVDRVHKYYEQDIHKRIIELGGLDWMWDSKNNKADLSLRSPDYLKRSTLAYEYKI